MATRSQTTTTRETDDALHPVERRIAKNWIKKRLAHVFPELRNNPDATEAAYQALDLQPRAGSLPEDAETIYEILHH